ncbi:MAG: amidohydrolase family protein [Methanoregulaceae archaeon]|nr:amidohydrolase family protein [Methanoregulaceae archaeon]
MDRDEQVIEGRAFIGDELEETPVAITVRKGIIRKIQEIPLRNLPWITPALFNAHTHIADGVAMDIPLTGPLEDIVTPPSGLKHRILERTPGEDLVRGMCATISTMETAGIGGFADFREGGIPGVRALSEAAAGLSCHPVILGRGGGELVADGAGISSVRDVPGLEAMVAEVRRAGKMLAIHAGERDPDDVDVALSYTPDLLVHGTHATRKQLRRISDEGIPVAVCPRSNWIFGVTDSGRRPPLREMIDLGCRLFIGTDNCMAVQPDLWREMSFISTIHRLDPGTIFRAAVSGSILSGTPYFIREGAVANFLVIDPAPTNLWLSRDPLKTLVTRAGSSDIVKKVISS